MSPRHKRMLIPLAGLYSSAIVFALLINYWLADLYASLCETSRETAFNILTGLLILTVVVRTILIWLGKDWASNRIETFFASEKEK
jgi:ABC-type transport system involved in cytochrome bd biosynthesis fused ATPase/permease subunit